MAKNCSFSGHRNSVKDLDINLLDRVILNLIKAGVENFYCGMAVGFDMIAAESLIDFKKQFNIKIIACIPCPGQSEKYSENNKIRYERILNNCDSEIMLAPSYYKGCMQARDRFMVDNSDVLISYLRKNKGGTYYTVNYARKKGIKIIEL